MYVYIYLYVSKGNHSVPLG